MSMKNIRKIFGVFLVFIAVLLLPLQSFAKLKNIEGNGVFHQDKIPVGKTGKIMSVTFYVETGSDYGDAWAGIAYDDGDDENSPNLRNRTWSLPFMATTSW